MKISYLLSLLIACAFPSPAKPICSLLFFPVKKELEDGIGLRCRQRPDFDVLKGGPGCQFTCIYKNVTCGALPGDACGRARFQIGIHGSVRRGLNAVAELCVLPEGILKRRFGRYCFAQRYCARYDQTCACRAIADGRRCHCRIEIDVNNNATAVTDCPVFDGFDGFDIDDDDAPPARMTAFLPSEDEVRSEMAMFIKDAGIRKQVEDGYSMYYDYFNSFE